ncbi:hypothetical protein [Actinomadura sp. WMMB 499]|uniref:hypothetical protein n=1 Tax=Actinomadura sp. WMMB 499 TaxID=1219491 RepID=UPI001246FFFE|nr:hypothetical protein [Actinomadura sp. WMMB 499]QFG20099.1 hypothetical protein F7P10_01885 [Actinomadura sp. WMMB 499]
MNIRLAGGVVAAGRCAWIPGPSGPARVDEADVRPGAPVALGPDGAPDDAVARAVAALRLLVADGGDAAAGAGVDLGAGFRSGRLAGARGDRRDAVLAALRAVGVRDAGRLGDRAGAMVALFGPAVTRRVGAAAARAAEEGRWDALHLASAASDVLGPEQLERVLDLDAPERLIPGGSPSALGADLRRVLEPLPGPRRLDVVLDLWGRLVDRRAEEAHRARRRATQSRRDRVEDLHARRRHFEDEQVLRWLRSDLGTDASTAEIARWVPPDSYWHIVLCGLLHDAFAATALLRTAVEVADHGVGEGLARSAPLLDAVMHESGGDVTVNNVRRVPGLTGLPARPGAYVRDLHGQVGKPADGRLAGYVRQRLARARDFALVIVRDIVRTLDQLDTRVPESALRAWADLPLCDWRERAGYTAARPPEEWDGIGAWAARMLDKEPLSGRVAEFDAADVEVVGDFLWYVELIDALARVHGHERAQALPGTGEPWYAHDVEPAPQPGPGYASLPQAVAGTAQLVAFGGVPPRGARTWPGLVDALLAGTAVSEALTGEFRVPAPLASRDGAEVHGHRVQMASTARDLAGWSAYMGNCIADEDYVEAARAGRAVLAGLYGPGGRLVANAELAPLKPAARGWHVTDFAGRFNHVAPPALEEAFHDWVAAIPGPPPRVPDAPPDGGVPPAPPARPVRRRAGERLLGEAGPALRELVRTDGAALDVLAAVAGTGPDAAPDTTAWRLRRSSLDRLARECARTLDERAADLVGLWDATGHRPLRDAVEALDPAVRDRFDRLPLLCGEPPLPKSLRRLVRLPGIADAYALDLAARRVRRALGLLAVRDDPALARAVRRRTTEPLLCALTVHTTCERPGVPLVPVTAPRRATVPGFPATTLADEDGPWRRALPAARELGADTGVFWEEVAEHGLRVPASWPAHGGWPALWSRAHR